MEKNVDVSQLVMLQPAITVVLAGARNARQAIANAKASDIIISEEEMKFINMQLSKV